MPDGSQEMTFWDHLEELRGSLLRVAAALVAAMVGCFIAVPHIFDSVILAPAHGDFFLYRMLSGIFGSGSFGLDIININVTAQFMTHISTSFALAVLVVFPYLVYELWLFVRPALYRNESRPVSFVFFFGTAMFYVGCALGYALVFPITLRFLTEYSVSSAIVNHISLDSYMHNFVLIILVMGIVFELPLVTWLLSRLGVINRAFLRQYRRHAVVVLLILAAIITPTGDPFTLMVVFLPLYLLYELGIWLAVK